ncbi:Small RNA 2'-O-methyltransferase [Boothiomyces macroporosus]|uniref:Small RNA 2'-O-methyltransferase n=1 Tax=Boothiomyces macroporosus TaxID=261099 RepID=A0AAD5UAN0_9FUNG|nr:Small RNA 2'-O-methyltransferase [Boothiomyces macroporosus]
MESEEKQEVKFNPPLWRQRRNFVSRYLKINSGFKKICDAGCGEGALLEILLNDTQFSLLAGIDIHRQSIIECYNRCKPNDMDLKYLRELPITLDLFHGSLEYVDKRLLGYDCFVLLEVIEHLDERTLEKLPQNLFGYYRPECIIISTPNAEFNVYFPDLKYGTVEQTFRHWDHKFEWTRKEFESWCKDCAEEYGYDVEFDGVGLLGPADRGYCTQIAIFTNPLRSTKSFKETETRYNYKYKIEYPYFEESGFTDLDIEDEVLDNLYMVITDWDEFQQSKKVELEHIWSILRIRQVCKYKKRLIEVLHSSRVLQLDGEYVEVLTDVQKPKELLLDNEDYQDDWGNDNSGWDSNDYLDDKDGWNSSEEPATKKWKESFDTTAVPSDSEIEIYEN